MDDAIKGMVLIFAVSLVVMLMRSKVGDKISIFILELPIVYLAYSVGMQESTFIPSVIIFIGLQFWLLVFFVISDMVAGKE
ncbi:hypothetical protein P7M42_14380 [Vibrio parahaemolyticus]|nr:hypothetical protein [Vibrio parahaemolyticus]HCE2311127.1 hypothetical protein [Vibrio parahaemolyticus]HCE4676053.1 hypothetical protein [Vibrio parahaemolyticus]HCG7256356.1 hypothetical protein [Vibrio parahaemolyticus]